MDEYIKKHTTAIEDCSIGEKEALTVKMATERGWSGFRIFPNGTLWAIKPSGTDSDYVPDYAQILQDAAPDLLAACEAAEKLLVKIGDPFDGDDWQAVQDIRAAIAKAKA